MLIENYYTILDTREEEGKTIFEIELQKECEVYKGHFPGEPISPGVCNITMLKECAEIVAHKALRIKYIQQCRMTKLITPETFPTLEVRVSLDDEKLHGSIGKEGAVFLELKGEVEEA